MIIRRSTLLGKQAHIWQRITAIYLLFTLPVLFIIAINYEWPTSYSEWQSVLGYNAFTAILWTSLIATFIHAWVGGRDIIIDYIPRKWTDSVLTLYFYSLMALSIHVHLLIML